MPLEWTHVLQVGGKDQVSASGSVNPQEDKTGQASVAHACNPSYSGSRDQEARGSKPVQTNCLWDPVLKISQKRACRVAQDVGPEFKSQYHKKEK
jgi:hypothetical protein